jgi:hypothetical protein
MDYIKIYNQIMERAKGRTPEKNGYYETHHIIPKCMGGDNSKSNKVKLTYREHFMAHWLLHRNYPNNQSLAASFHIMAYGTSWREGRKLRGNYFPSSRQLEEARLAKVMARRGKKHSEETKRKMSESAKLYRQLNPIVSEKGIYKHTEESKIKMREAKLGKKRSDEVKLKISETKKLTTPKGSNHWAYGKKHSDETIIKLIEARNKRNNIRHS